MYPHTVVALFSDRILHITCHSQAHAISVVQSYSDAIETFVCPATAGEVTTMEFDGVCPGATLVDRLRIDDYFARLVPV